MEGLSAFAFFPDMLNSTLSSCGLSRDEIRTFKKQTVWALLADFSITGSQAEALLVISIGEDKPRGVLAARELYLADKGIGKRAWTCWCVMGSNPELRRRAELEAGRSEGLLAMSPRNKWALEKQKAINARQKAIEEGGIDQAVADPEESQGSK